jgi:predicted transcriptional regulator
MDNMLQNSLISCGLDETEQILLLLLLENGSAVASNIASKTGVKRPTAYAALGRLVDMEIVERQKKQGVTYYSALPVETILKILENKAEMKYRHSLQSVKVLRNELEKHKRKQQFADVSGYEISSLEGFTGLKAELPKVLMGGDYDCIFNPQINFEREDIREINLEFLDRAAKTHPHIREIVVVGKWADWYQKHNRNPHHIIKELPAGTKIYSDMFFTKGDVYLGHFEKHRESFIRITQVDYYETMKTLFERMWGSL